MRRLRSTHLCLLMLVWTSLVVGRAVGENTTSSESFHFTYDILPILAKSGCSAAECHGSATGRGGFKLSLFGSDPRSDYETITQELGGRRVDELLPANSLILKKPTRQMRHGGGRRFHRDDRAFKDLLRWIERGTPYIKGEPKNLIDLRLKPDTDGTLRYAVIATFQTPNGRQEHNVTRLAMLNSTNDLVATVDKHGNVARQGPGEAWILARYGHLSARTSIKQAFPHVENISYTTTTPTDSLYRPHPLDEVWLKRIKEFGLIPAPSASDSVLVRRLYLDLAGRPPSPYEVDRFSGLPDKDRVEVTVNGLLKSSEFSEVFALRLGEWFEVPTPGKDGRNDRKRNDFLRQFFRESMQANDSVSEIVRKILTEEGPKQAWQRFGDPRDRAEFVGRSMLGLSIGCARCHNHPLDRWKRTEHLQFSAYFTDLRPSAGGGMMMGKFFQPENGKLIEPVLLPLSSSEPNAELSSAQKLTWLVLEGGGDQFARNIANRVFGVLIGKYLVNPPTDHRLSNPAIHEPILDLLTETFRASGTDLRELVHFIVTSRLYALSSDPTGEESLSGDPVLQYMARREARPLSAAQFKAAVEFVVGVEIKQPSPPESPLSRQLYIMNSGLIQAGLEQAGNQVDAVFDFEIDASKQLEDLYTLILSRPPRSEERRAFVPILAEAMDARTAGKDLAFALLASREFGSLR